MNAIWLSEFWVCQLFDSGTSQCIRPFTPRNPSHESQNMLGRFGHPAFLDPLGPRSPKRKLQ